MNPNSDKVPEKKPRFYNGRYNSRNIAPADSQKLNLEASLSSLSLSPTGDRLVVCGRDVLKIVNVKFREQSFSQGQALRENMNRPKIIETVDAQWCPTKAHLIASSAKAKSEVVIWNVHRFGGHKKTQTLSDHTRTVNRVSWHPAFHQILTGSQDGTMKLWDLRTKTCRSTFDGKNREVRDVKFHPTNYNMFAAAFGTGSIQAWDMRKPEKFSYQICEHSGPVLTLDWHPSDPELLASGSSDKSIKVWKTLNHKKPLYTIATIGGLSRIQWHPDNSDQIASASKAFDNAIHVWDVKDPFVPIRSHYCHTQVVTGFSWQNTSSESKTQESIISCSGDGNLCWNSNDNAYIPRDHMSPVSVAWSITGEVAFTGKKKKREKTKSEIDGGTPMLPFLSSFEDETYHPAIPEEKEDEEQIERVKTTSPEMDVFGSQTKMKESELFYHFANNYKLSGSEAPALCEHNQQAAKDVGQTQLAQTWGIVKLLLEQQSYFLDKSADHLQADVHKKQLAMWDLQHDNFSDDSNTVGYVGDLLADAPTNLPMFVDDHQYDIHDKVHSEQVEHSEFNVSSPTQNDKDIGSLIQCLPEFGLSHNVHQLFSDGEEARLSHSETQSHDSLTMSHLQTVREEEELEGVESDHIQEMSDTDEGEEKYGDAIYHFEDDEHDKHSSDHAAVAYRRQIKMPNTNITSELGTQPFFGDACSYSFIKLIDHLTDIGDLQTSVALIIILGSRIEMKPNRRMDIFHSYIELLQRHKMWPNATEIIELAPDTQIHRINNNSTHMSLGCPGCSRTMNGTVCKYCDVSSTKCAICNVSVTGIYVWCQGCGHGGHLSHIKEWFKMHTECPTGCAHKCVPELVV